jgi:hypothetical protein
VTVSERRHLPALEVPHTPTIGTFAQVPMAPRITPHNPIQSRRVEAPILPDGVASTLTIGKVKQQSL